MKNCRVHPTHWLISTQAGINRNELALLSQKIPAARQITKDAVYLATGLDASSGLRAGTELPPWVPGSLNLRSLFTGGFVISGGYVTYDGGTLFCNLGVQYYTFDGSTLLLDKGSEPKMTKPRVVAARAMRDEVVEDEAYLERLHERDRARDDARDAEPLPPPSKRRWVPTQSWEAYARGERAPAQGPPSLGTKRDVVEDLKWGASYRLYGLQEAVDVLYTKKWRGDLRALAAFSILGQYEDDGPEDGSFEGIDVRSELKARAEGFDIFIYDEDKGTPLDKGVEVRWQGWTASTIYLAPHRDEENAVAVITLRNDGLYGRRSGHAYALVKPKAGGGPRDFEFANYPAFLVIARD